MTVDQQIYLNSLGQEMVVLGAKTAKYDNNMDRYADYMRRHLRLTMTYFGIIDDYLNARIWLSVADMNTVMRKINNLLGTSYWCTIP
jgi:hypothetical protein